MVGLFEGLFRGVSVPYSLFLYGALCAAAGMAGAILLSLIVKERGVVLGAGLITWGVALTTAASALVLVRFIVQRDVLQEAPGSGTTATGAGAGAAVGVFLVFYLIGRIWGGKIRKRDPLRRLKKTWLWPALTVMVFFFMTLSGDDAIPAQTRPEPLAGRGVVLVVVDTVRADVLGAYGAGEHRGAPPSPNIDELATRGRLFSDVSAQASWTKPAMATIVTSRHASGHGTMSKPAILPESLPTIATVLKAAKIGTGGVVTNYNLEEGFGFARGFDRFEYLAPARYLGAPKRANRLAAYNVYRVLREKLLTGGREAKNFYRSGASVNAVGFEILAELAKKPEDRFFLWLHYMEPHDPYFSADGKSYARVSHPHPPAEWAEAMKLAYRDDVLLFDRFLGDLMSGLAARGLAETTDVILLSDHGEEFDDHGGFYHGVTLYEEQLHVPLIMTGPNVPAGVEADLARQVDIAPTVAALFGVKAPESWEGRDLLGDTEVPPVAIAEEDHEGNQLSSVRYTDPEKPLKLITANPGNPRGLGETELYDLGKDPGEKQSMTSTAPKVVEALRAAFGKAQKQSKVGGAVAGSRVLDADAAAELRALGYMGEE